MYTIQTEIEINATPQHIWAILMDSASYAQWNPLIPSFVGKLALGETIAMTIQPARGKSLVARCKVTALEPAKKLAWLGGLPLLGLLSGEHCWIIEPLSNGKVLFRNSETLRGLLVPLVRGLYDRNFIAPFVAMNEALKQRAESDRLAN